MPMLEPAEPRSGLHAMPWHDAQGWRQRTPAADDLAQQRHGKYYPDGATGNCTACHTRHLFAKAEARKPAACASCHLGPDHPDIEIYENSKHGQLYQSEGRTWNFDKPADNWRPGDYPGQPAPHAT